MILVFLSVGPQSLLWGADMDSHILTAPQQSTAAPVLPRQVLSPQALLSLAHTCHTEQMLLHLRLQSWFETPSKPGAAFSGISEAATGSPKAKPWVHEASLTPLQVPQAMWGLAAAPCRAEHARGTEVQGNATNLLMPAPTSHKEEKAQTKGEQWGSAAAEHLFVFFLGLTTHTVEHKLQIDNGTATQTIKAT